MRVIKYQFERHGDSRGQLVALEEKRDIPFDIKRVYYMYDTVSGVRRGGHAHKKLNQVLICVHGSCKVFLDDGESKETIDLDNPYEGILITQSMWREMYDFSQERQGAIFMDAFFLLSGFCIMYCNEKLDLLDKKNIIYFYVHHLLNIYPVYFVIYVLHVVSNKDIALVDNLILAPMEILTLQSLLGGTFILLNNSGTWFISCLVIAYLCFPFIGNLISRINTKKRILVGLILYLLISYLQYVSYHFGLGTAYTNPMLRLMEFSIGIVIASCYQKIKNVYAVNLLKNRMFTIFLCICFLFCISTLSERCIGDYSCYAIITIPFFGILLLWCVLSNKSEDNICNSKIVRFLSAISYTFLMAQFLVWDIMVYVCRIYGDLLKEYIDLKLFFCALLITFSLAILMYYCICKPVKFFERK